MGKLSALGPLCLAQCIYFLRLLTHPIKNEEEIDAYFMCEIDIKHVKFPVFLNYIALLIDYYVRVVSLIRAMINRFVESAK